MQYLIR